MKKAAALCLLICLLLGLTACGFSSGSSEPDGPKLYPRSTKESLYQESPTFPEIIFSTMGTENQLKGTVYSFSGTWKGVYEELGEPYYVVETEQGDVLISNVYECIKDIGGIEPDMYRTPEVGEAARFTCIYDGFSVTASMPCFIFGNDDFLLKPFGKG